MGGEQEDQGRGVSGVGSWSLDGMVCNGQVPNGKSQRYNSW